MVRYTSSLWLCLCFFCFFSFVYIAFFFPFGYLESKVRSFFPSLWSSICFICDASWNIQSKILMLWIQKILNLCRAIFLAIITDVDLSYLIRIVSYFLSPHSRSFIWRKPFNSILSSKIMRVEPPIIYRQYVHYRIRPLYKAGSRKSLERLTP